METIAFRMKLKPGMAAEDKRRHGEIWPAMLAMLRAAGTPDHSIFLDRETGTLFAALRRADDDGMQALATNPVELRWNEHVADLLDTNPDKSAVVAELVTMFHTD